MCDRREDRIVKSGLAMIFIGAVLMSLPCFVAILAHDEAPVKAEVEPPKERRVVKIVRWLWDKE